MKVLNRFKVVRTFQTGFAESVATFLTDVALYVAVSGVADAVLPVSFASTFRTRNGGYCFQLLLALPFHK